MKKLLIVALMLAMIPAFAVEVGGQLDLNYIMETPNDDLIEPESYFGMVSTKLTFKQELMEGTTGFVKMNLLEPKSDGMDSVPVPAGGFIVLEEMWAAKTGAFGQEALGFKFGKMEVPFNLDVDNGITHSMTNRSGGAYASGLGATGEIDFTWGLNVNYGLGEGMGTINLTIFEGAGGINAATGEDADTGMFQSIALNWDTGKDVDAFGVAGLRIVVGYAMYPNDTLDESANDISIGATYTLKDLGLCIGLEIIMSSEFAADCMIIALDVDYKQELFEAGLTYEQATFDTADTSDSRIAIRGAYILDENNKLRLEYAMTDNADNDDAGESRISLGYLATF